MPREPRDTLPNGRPFPPAVLEKRAKWRARQAAAAAKAVSHEELDAKVKALEVRAEALERRAEALERRP